MPHGKLHFPMPAPSARAFEAFFNHRVRLEWDTLLRVNYVEGGGDHAYAGAITVNRGSGWKGGFEMRTRFLTYDPPHMAAAELLAPTGLFALWAATMRFRDTREGGSEMTYTYTLRMRPRALAWLLDPLANALFARETRRRFAAMAEYLRAQPTAPTTSGAGQRLR